MQVILNYTWWGWASQTAKQRKRHCIEICICLIYASGQQVDTCSLHQLTHPPTVCLYLVYLILLKSIGLVGTQMNIFLFYFLTKEINLLTESTWQMSNCKIYIDSFGSQETNVGLLKSSSIMSNYIISKQKQQSWYRKIENVGKLNRRW